MAPLDVPIDHVAKQLREQCRLVRNLNMFNIVESRL